MFTGKALFPGTSTLNQLERVIAWTGTPTASETKHLSSSLNPALQNLLYSRKKMNKN